MLFVAKIASFACSEILFWQFFFFVTFDFVYGRNKTRKFMRKGIKSFITCSKSVQWSCQRWFEENLQALQQINHMSIKNVCNLENFFISSPCWSESIVRHTNTHLWHDFISVYSTLKSHQKILWKTISLRLLFCHTLDTMSEFRKWEMAIA